MIQSDTDRLQLDRYVGDGQKRDSKEFSHRLPGWWLTYPSEKYDFVSWDDSSQHMESHKSI